MIENSPACLTQCDTDLAIGDISEIGGTDGGRRAAADMGEDVAIQQQHRANRSPIDARKSTLSKKLSRMANIRQSWMLSSVADISNNR